MNRCATFESGKQSRDPNLANLGSVTWKRDMEGNPGGGLIPGGGMGLIS